MALGINGLTVLQGLRYSKKAMAYMCIGILIKLILQYPLVYLFQGDGAIITTDFAFLFVGILAYSKLIKLFKINFRSHLKVIVLNLLFLSIVFGCHTLFTPFFYEKTKFMAFIATTIIGLLFLIFYIVLIDIFNISYQNWGHYILIKKHIAKY